MAKLRDSLYCAVDVGTTKVSTLVGRVTSEGTVEIVALGNVSSAGMKKGMVVNPEEMADSIRRSAHQAQMMLGSRLPAAYVGITGSYLTCLNASAAMSLNKNRNLVIGQRDIDRLLRNTTDRTAQKNRLIHVIPRSYSLDGLDRVRNPVGMSGQQITSESHVVMGDPAPIENLAKVVQSAGVTIKGLVIEHLASSEAVLTTDERETGVVLVDIGGGTSDIAIFKDGTIWHTAALAVGGWQFTNDLSQGLSITLGAAEQAKLLFGSIMLEDPDPKDTLEVPTGRGDATKTVPSLTLYSLLHARTVDLISIVVRAVKDSGLERMPAGGLVLTGGTSNLPGLVDIAADYAACPARQGSPSHTLGLPQELEDAKFATAVGLLLWGIRRGHLKRFTGQAISLSIPAMQRLRHWISRFGFNSRNKVRS